MKLFKNSQNKINSGSFCLKKYKNDNTQGPTMLNIFVNKDRNQTLKASTNWGSIFHTTGVGLGDVRVDAFYVIE